MTGLAAPPLVLGEGGFLWYAIVCVVLALVAAFGMRGLAGLSMGIAKILVVVFLVLAVVSPLL